MNGVQLSVLDIHSQDCLAAFEVMRELRSQLTDAAAFAEQIRGQAQQGYRLLAAWRGNQLVGLAGYRIQENLLYGRFLYVDDLVALAGARRHGTGGKLMEALREEAKQRGCAHLVLDTALGNVLAQRFYFREGLLPKGLHFSQALGRPEP